MSGKRKAEEGGSETAQSKRHRTTSPDPRKWDVRDVIRSGSRTKIAEYLLDELEHASKTEGHWRAIVAEREQAFDQMTERLELDLADAKEKLDKSRDELLNAVTASRKDQTEIKTLQDEKLRLQVTMEALLKVSAAMEEKLGKSQQEAAQLRNDLIKSLEQRRDEMLQKTPPIVALLGIVPPDKDEIHQYALVRQLPGNRTAECRARVVKIRDPTELDWGGTGLGVCYYDWDAKEGKYTRVPEKQKTKPTPFTNAAELVCSMDRLPKSREENAALQDYLVKLHFYSANLQDTEPVQFVSCDSNKTV